MNDFYGVYVNIFQHVDQEKGFLCGYLKIKGLTDVSKNFADVLALLLSRSLLKCTDQRLSASMILTVQETWIYSSFLIELISYLTELTVFKLYQTIHLRTDVFFCIKDSLFCLNSSQCKYIVHLTVADDSIIKIC